MVWCGIICGIVPSYRTSFYRFVPYRILPFSSRISCPILSYRTASYRIVLVGSTVARATFASRSKRDVVQWTSPDSGLAHLQVFIGRVATRTPRARSVQSAFTGSEHRAEGAKAVTSKSGASVYQHCATWQQRHQRQQPHKEATIYGSNNLNFQRSNILRIQTINRSSTPDDLRIQRSTDPTIYRSSDPDDL